MKKNNNFDSALKKLKAQAKKSINKQNITDFFVLNKQRKVIEFLLTTEEQLLLTYYLKSLVPEELVNFIDLRLKNELEEEIVHWYFEEEIIIVEISIDWGNQKQTISIEVDTEQFEMLIEYDSSLQVKALDYTMLSDFLSQFVQRQAKMITEVFEGIKLKNSKKKERSMKDFME